MRLDSILAIEPASLATVKKATIAEANFLEVLDLVELTLLANLNAVANNLYTFSVLSSHDSSVMFIADV